MWPVTYRVSAGPTIISGSNNLAFTGLGVVTVVVEQSGDSYFYAASSVEQSFRVLPAVAPEVGPVLHVAVDGRALSLTWPATSLGYALEWTSRLPAGAWAPIGVTVLRENNVFRVELPLGDGGFYRLRK